MRLRLSVLLLVLGCVLGLENRAQAATVRDGEDFSIGFGDTRICFLSPPDLKTDDDCDGLPSISAPQVSTAKIHPLAAGIVRAPGSRKSPRIFALVQAYRVDIGNPKEVTLENTKEFAALLANSIAANLPAGLVSRPPVTRIEKVGDVSVLRFVFEVDGLSPAPDNQLIEAQRHTEVVAIPLIDAWYVVEWKGSPLIAMTLAHLADATLPTIRFAPRRAPPRPEAVASSSSFGLPLAMPVGAGLLAVALVALARHSKNRRRNSTFHGELWPPQDS